jgi:hypothetical protein
VDRLAGFYSDSPSSGPVLPSRARNATQLYRGFYQVAVPFDVRSLLRLWESCDARSQGGAGCAEGLAEARALSGAVPAASSAPSPTRRSE